MIQRKSHYVSLDLWDTVLRRKCHPDEVKLFTAQCMLHQLHPFIKGKLPDVFELLHRRQLIEAKIGKYQQSLGNDDEYEIEEVIRRCIIQSVNSAIDRDKLNEITSLLVNAEIEHEISVTYLDDDLMSLLYSISFEEIYVISDFYMSAQKVRRIVRSHHFPFPINQYFISCDIGLNKRSGRLFHFVCSKLGIEPNALLHIGDNKVADIESASKCAIETIYFSGNSGQEKRKKNEDFFNFRMQAKSKPETCLVNTLLPSSLSLCKSRGDERGHLFDYGQFISPLFIGFSLYIQEICHAHNHQHIYFFTREGIFLKQVFDRVQQCNLYNMKPVKTHVLPVSRLATFFPSLQELTPKALMRLWSQYHTQSINTLLGSLNVQPECFDDIFNRIGISAVEIINSPWQDERIHRLFADGEFVQKLSHKQREQRDNIIEFMGGLGFGQNGKAMIIDIGWRGTIQDNLAQIFPDIQIDGCYLGLHRFLNQQPKNTRKYGFLADENRGEEHVSLRYVIPFEMLCFSAGGSAVGYRRDSSGMVTADFLCDQEEDQIHREWMHFFQEGVKQRVAKVCTHIHERAISTAELRKEARSMARDYLDSPPRYICAAYNELKQDDTFGMARSIFPGQKTFRISDRMLSYFSATRRQRFLDDLGSGGWPQCMLRTRYYGFFHHLNRIKRLFL